MDLKYHDIVCIISMDLRLHRQDGVGGLIKIIPVAL